MYMEDITAVAIVDRNSTVVELCFPALIDEQGNEEEAGWSVTASSKREPGEPFNERIGYDFALSRALANAAKVIHDRALADLAELEAQCPPQPSGLDVAIDHLYGSLSALVDRLTEAENESSDIDSFPTFVEPVALPQSTPDHRTFIDVILGRNRDNI